MSECILQWCINIHLNTVKSWFNESKEWTLVHVTKMKFHIQKSRFSIKSRFTEWKSADWDLLNRDFTVLIQYLVPQLGHLLVDQLEVTIMGQARDRMELTGVFGVLVLRLSNNISHLLSGVHCIHIHTYVQMLLYCIKSIYLFCKYPWILL